jgi:diguanylate cyclase (GGDEF)-like protein
MTPTLQKELPPALLRAENLPTLPAVALEVLRLTQDENTTIEDLAQCLARDPVLSAKLLRISNSSLFGQGQEISTLQRATVVLGTKTVMLMSLSFSLAHALPKTGRAAGFDLLEYWRRSLVRSVAAKVFARVLGSRRGDEAFLCALFGHLGRLVLARALPEIYAPVVTACGGWPTSAEEQERLGFTSTEACAALLSSWQMPAHLSQAVLGVERELAGDASAEVRELVRILRLASLAEAVLCDAHKGQALCALREMLRTDVGLADGEVDALLVSLESVIVETGKMLSLELPAGVSHEGILEQARQQMVQVGVGAALDLEQARRANAELVQETRRLATQARTDALTGLPNRAAFEEYLGAKIELRMQERQPLGLGLILLDLDHFKHLNDSYGHPAGDEVLRMVARAMQRATRKSDFAARLGGEEFALVLTNVSPHSLRAVAERVRLAIAGEGVSFEGQMLSVTASLGGACITDFSSLEDGPALVKLADHYLYRAKQAGRNRCEIHARLRFPGR